MQKKFCVAIDIGGSHTTIARLEQEGDSIPSISCSSTTKYNYQELKKESFRSLILKGVKDVMETGGEGEVFAGVGMVVPALVCEKELRNPYFPALEQSSHLYIEIADLVGQRCDVMNDADAAALAEARYGAARGASRSAYFTISTGVGGAVVSDGRVENGLLGEMIVQMDHAHPDERGSSSINSLAQTEWFRRQPPHFEEPKILAALADQGDMHAQEIFARMGSTLGLAVSSLVNSRLLDMVVIGGGTSLAHRWFFPQVRQMVLRHASQLLRPNEIPEIVPAHFGADSALYGAATLVLE